MSDMIKIAVDAMGGDNSPDKIINGIIHHHRSNKKIFYKIFGDKNQINKLINDKAIKSNRKFLLPNKNSFLISFSLLIAIN